jgi:hypothetical protein
MKRLLMAEQWNEFARLVLPGDVSAVQRREMRRAFYAGGQAIIFRIVTALAPDAEPTEADLQLMDDLHQELNAFTRDVIAGRA